MAPPSSSPSWLSLLVPLILVHLACTATCNNSSPGGKRGYHVMVVNRALGPDGGSIISSVNGSSSFKDNFNAAWLPLRNNRGGGLFVRVTDTNTAAATYNNVGTLGKGCIPTSAGSDQSHSRIAFVPAVDGIGLRFAHVDQTRLIVPVAPSLDPRATFRPLTNTSFLTYQCNVASNSTTIGGRNVASNSAITGGRILLRRTFIAATTTPDDPSSWVDQPAPMFSAPSGVQDCGTCLWFPEDNESGSQGGVAGANLPPAYALATFGGLRGGNITLARSTDGLKTWTTLGTLLETRPDHWDNRTLSSAACPHRLSDGNWLFLYNVDNKWPVDNPKPIPSYGRCALGWAILSKHNVSKVLARAEAPLLYASEPYDTSPQGGAPSVYTDGIRDEGGDVFVVYAGGQDQVVEAVRIKVFVPEH